MPTTTSRLLKPLQRGDSGLVQVGQDIYAIGHPFNMAEQSLTKGIVSGVGRTIPSAANGRPIQGMIQTDAALNPGNSGGPILNSDGQVVGMTSEILSPTGASVGIGYAVPSDTISARVASILKYGYVARPTLGVLFGADSAARHITGHNGAIIAAFQPNSVAKAGGFKVGDIICSVGDTPIRNTNDIYAMVDVHRSGEQVEVGVLRPVVSGPDKISLRTLSLKVVLAEAAPEMLVQPSTDGEVPPALRAAYAASLSGAPRWPPM